MTEQGNRVRFEDLEAVLDCAEDAQRVAEAAVAWRVAVQSARGFVEQLNAKELLLALTLEIDRYREKWGQ